MRGAILMCSLAICAALALHFFQAAGVAQRLDTGRSDPLVSMVSAYAPALAENAAFHDDIDDQLDDDVSHKELSQVDIGD